MRIPRKTLAAWLSVAFASAILALIGSLLIKSGTSDPHGAASVVSPQGFRISIEAPKQSILGSRMWVAVTIENATDRVKGGPTKELFPFEFFCFTCSLSTIDTRQTVAKSRFNPLVLYVGGHHVDELGREREERWPFWKMQARESLRLLFPFGAGISKEVKPGVYDLEITILDGGGFDMATAPPVRLRIRDPSPDEARVLQAIGTQALNSRFRSDNPYPPFLRGPLKDETGLGFELLLFELYRSPKPISDMNEEDLGKGLPPIFRPELDVIRYEILRAKKLDDAAAELRERTVREYPGLRYRFENADNGRGILAVGKKRDPRQP